MLAPRARPSCFISILARDALVHTFWKSDTAGSRQTGRHLCLLIFLNLALV